MAAKQRLGDLLVEKGLVDRQAVEEALRLQVGGNRRLGHILIKMGRLTEDQLLDVLAEQLGMPIVDVEAEIKEEVRQVVPRYLCRKYGIVPLSRKKEHNILRLAMMNPMDDEAIGAVEDYTGMAVRPELARRSVIKAAIDKHIPLTRADIWNMLTMSPRLMATLGLVLVLVVAGVAGHSWYRDRYGEISRLADRVIYKNFDLTIEVANDGKEVSLRGRGSHSTGIFMVSFPGVSNLQRFIAKKQSQFSTEELAWLRWVLDRIGAPAGPTVADAGGGMAGR